MCVASLKELLRIFGTGFRFLCHKHKCRCQRQGGVTVGSVVRSCAGVALSLPAELMSPENHIGPSNSSKHPKI